MKRHRTKEYSQLMNSRRWRRLRAAYLSAHPLCEDCEQQGRTTIATEVHHIRPIESAAGRPGDMQELAFNPCNLRALCKACHIEAHRVLHSNSLSASKERARAELSAFASAYLSE
nr:MAG TPA: HNH endonuclease [Caudoviricetes sp.]